eukprot:11599364-Alexandrium_andersonii.AAC.1
MRSFLEAEGAARFPPARWSHLALRPPRRRLPRTTGEQGRGRSASCASRRIALSRRPTRPPLNVGRSWALATPARDLPPPPSRGP